jgi:hypothetical protein
MFEPEVVPPSMPDPTLTSLFESFRMALVSPLPPEAEIFE